MSIHNSNLTLITLLIMLWLENDTEEFFILYVYVIYAVRKEPIKRN